MLNINETFTTDELKVLKEELLMRVDDWDAVLEDDPNEESVKKRLSAVKKLYEAIDTTIKESSTTTEIYTPFSGEYDITFVMEDTYVNGELRTTECIGWYHGAPNKECTESYADRKMKAYLGNRDEIVIDEMADALEQFGEAYRKIREYWYKDIANLGMTDAIDKYPFSKSFNELTITEWVNETVKELRRK